ncbi:9442_t:CDS:2 [Entrophospora sp. SA101]|nr:9442_t:CDS:2 [Entrophospora sp. SA101]CAJ0843601.1 22046_t:CDS:2 [Entrophospora sp. SA101]CAJ0906871.1 3087_t:CDS:2 [Entrophospora sp. SA101]
MPRKSLKKSLKSRPDSIIRIRKDVEEDDKYYIKIGPNAEENFEFPDPQTILQVCKGSSDLWRNSLDQRFKYKFELLSNKVKNSYKQKELFIQMYNPLSSPSTNDSNKDNDDYYYNTATSKGSIENKETGDDINILAVENQELTNEERINIATQLFPSFSNYTENNFDAGAGIDMSLAASSESAGIHPSN